MKYSVLVAFLAFTQVVGAESIHSIVRGNQGEPHLVKLNSGEVIFIEAQDEAKLASYEKQVKSMVQSVASSVDNKMALLEETEFVPSLVPDSELQNIFNRMNPFMKRKSECSDRAHVWAWDENQKTGIQMEKAFLLLTDSYIKRNRYKWWFHVAPLYTTTSGQKIVMDYQFLDRPVTFTEWKNFLVFSKRDCVTDFKFLDYNAGADQTQDCYSKFEPMYYRIPGDIGTRELGSPRIKWSEFEVNSARARAFYKRSL